jgi:hypothetical protein
MPPYQIVDKKAISTTIMTPETAVMMILTSIRRYNKKYSLAKKIDTPPVHSINALT